MSAYLFRIICLCLFVSILCALLPTAWKKKHIDRLCSIAFVLLLLSPIMKLDTQQIASSISSVFLDTEQSRIGFEIENASVLEQLVCQRTERCILDQAEALGMKLTVQVFTEWYDHVPFPSAVHLNGTYTEKQQTLLMVYLERELGIQEEHQIWGS